jgi:hypothetical protein
MDTPASAEPAVAVSETAARPRGRRRAAVTRWTKRLIAVAVGLFAAVLVTLFTVDIGDISIAGRSLRTIAESEGTKQLKRPLRIGRISALLTPGKFAFDDVTIEGPAKDDRPFFHAKRITLSLPWWALLRSPREMYLDVHLFDWRMVVENWATGGARLPNLKFGRQGGGGPKLQVRAMSVYAHRGEFIFDDHVSNWGVICRNLEFALVRAANLNSIVGTARYTDGTTRIQSFLPMKTDFSTRFQLQGGRVELHHIDLLTDGARSHVSGYVNFGNWPEQEYAISSEVDFARMREIFFGNADWRVSGDGTFQGIFKFWRTQDASGQFQTGRDLSGQFQSEEAGLTWGSKEWRFPHLHGALQWTPTRFAVTHAESELLGGSMRLTYGFPLGQPGATTNFTVDYQDVDLHRFTRQWSFTALEPQGRMRGKVVMNWPNGRFREAMQGVGETFVQPPAGEAVAAATLVPDAAPNVPEPRAGFIKQKPYGFFPVAADTKYRFTASSLDFEPGWVATPKTYVTFSGRARGSPVNVPFHVTSHSWQDSDRLFAAIMTNFSRTPMGAIPVGGRGTFDGALTGAFNAPRIEGRFSGDQMYVWDVDWGAATGRVVIENGYMHLTDGVITHESGGKVFTSGKYSLGYPRADGGEEIAADVRVQSMPLDPLKTAFELTDWPVTGTIASAMLRLENKYLHLSDGGKPGSMQILNGTAWGESFEAVTSTLVFEGNGSLRLRGMRMEKDGGLITGDAWVSWEEDKYSFRAGTEGTGIPVEKLKTFQIPQAPLSGQLTFKADGAAPFDFPEWSFRGNIADLYAGGEGVGAVVGTIALADQVLKLDVNVASVNRLSVTGGGEIALNEAYDSKLHLRFTDTSIDPYLKFVAQDLPYTKAIAGGSVSIVGPLKDWTRLTVNATVDKANLTLFDYPIENDGDIVLLLKNNVFRLERVNFKGASGENLVFSGQVDGTARTADVRANGSASLAVLQAFYPDLTASGNATITAALTGSFDRLVVNGKAEIQRGRLRHPALRPHGFSEINGPIVMQEGRVSVDQLRAVLGEGPVTFGGAILLDGYRPVEYSLEAHGRSMHLQVPAGLRSTVNADLTLRGPIKFPVLAGEINVIRATYAPRVQTQAGYYELLTGGAEPVAPEGLVLAPEAEAAIPLQLAIKVRSDSIPFIQNKQATITGSADVDIAGTISDPIVTGSVRVDSGGWLFGPFRYTLQPGLIEFSNPLQFDPFFDMTATTRIRTASEYFDVTLRLFGTLSRFDFSLTSEPWLPEFQIISALLGETPAVGRAELLARSAPEEIRNQALRTAGLAFLASPISSTVGSVAERVTAIDTVQIMPILGNETNLQQLSPMARITLGKRLSDRFYLIYSRTLTNQPTLQNEVILIEFDQNDQVSWILSRNEDRSFALDFRIKHVFR